MKKSELVEAIARGSEITKAEADRVITVFTKTITEALQNGDTVVLPGFGSWSVRPRSARKGRNPQTGEEILIKASRIAKFKAGKKLKEAVEQ